VDTSLASRLILKESRPAQLCFLKFRLRTAFFPRSAVQKLKFPLLVGASTIVMEELGRRLEKKAIYYFCYLLWEVMRFKNRWQE
jgi:hypothetical protein